MLQDLDKYLIRASAVSEIIEEIKNLPDPRNGILYELEPYFKYQDLVPSVVAKKYKEESWDFIDLDLLYCLFFVRKVIGIPGIINSKKYNRDESGLRCNLSSLVSKKKRLYLSAHIFGKAFDLLFAYKGTIQQRVKLIADVHKVLSVVSLYLPCKIRIEVKADISWLHLDVMPHHMTKEQITFIKV